MYTYTTHSVKPSEGMLNQNMNNLFMCSHLTVGDNVRIAGSVYMTSVTWHEQDPSAVTRKANDDDHKDGILLQDNVWLQAGVSVMPGVTIGKGAIVIKGSVVTKDIPAGVVAGGIPARPLYRQRTV